MYSSLEEIKTEQATELCQIVEKLLGLPEEEAESFDTNAVVSILLQHPDKASYQRAFMQSAEYLSEHLTDKSSLSYARLRELLLREDSSYAIAQL